MAGELEGIVRDLFDAFERKDLSAVAGRFADDVQGVDEISRRWLRGRSTLDEYLAGLVTMVDDVRSELNDVSESVVGDTGVLTCWLEQDYTFQGESQHVSAPTSVVFHRGGDGWKIMLFHSIPTQEGEQAPAQ
jgi:ketosteroid isomerase-like protein